MLKPFKTSSTPPLNRNSLDSLNSVTSKAFNAQNITSLNSKTQQAQAVRATTPPQHSMRSTTAAAPSKSNVSSAAPVPPPVRAVHTRSLPRFQHPVQRGQKTLVCPHTSSGQIKVCVGWNVSDARCDIDVSAFLLTANGKVQNDSWFVFYGQERSPDQSTYFHDDPTGADREIIDICLNKVSPSIQKIVFVLTIDEAFEKKLNFNMVRDAYVRILDFASGKEILSYKVGSDRSSITSLTIGELYRRNGEWKFNPIGEGVNKDLAGQCAIYGVQVSE